MYFGFIFIRVGCTDFGYNATKFKYITFEEYVHKELTFSHQKFLVKEKITAELYKDT